MVKHIVSYKGKEILPRSYDKQWRAYFLISSFDGKETYHFTPYTVTDRLFQSKEEADLYAIDMAKAMINDMKA